MEVRTDYNGNPDITPGKLYEVIKYDPKEPGDLCAGAEIVDDAGCIIYIFSCQKHPSVAFWMNLVFGKSSRRTKVYEESCWNLCEP